VAGVNDLPAADGTAIDLSGSYTQAGGRALRLPAVLAALDSRGWDGAQLRDLAGLRPLGTIAGRLRPRPGPAA
jgi:hypothetical protein